MLKVCKVCTCSAQSLPKNPRFVWRQPRVLKNADLMRTLCRLLQTYCRTDADLYKCVQLEHFFCHTPSIHNRNHADFVHTYADIMQTLNRHYAHYHTRVHREHFSVVISGKFPYIALCRTHMVSKGRISTRCFQAFRRVEKQEDQG